MATRFEQDAAKAQESDGKGSRISVATGTVENNIDLITEGKIEVRVPSLNQTLWARLVGTGGGDDAGFFYVPRVGDEVLVAFADYDPTEGFVLGGLWSLRDRIPVTDPVTALTTRVIKSGVAPGTGHEIEFDDLLQSVTITTVTRQKITMDPTKIELTNLAGTVSISLDNITQSITIRAVKSINLEALEISLKGAKVEINGATMATVKSAALCNITAPLVTIN
jgi:uncharacterized protein involved in type VI secretion and phage assembly